MKWYGKLYIGILIAILYIPILFLMVYSFNSAGNMIHFEHFTLEHYQTLFQDDRLMSVIFNTIAIALLAPQSQQSSVPLVRLLYTIYVTRNLKLLY